MEENDRGNKERTGGIKLEDKGVVYEAHLNAVRVQRRHERSEGRVFVEVVLSRSISSLSIFLNGVSSLTAIFVSLLPLMMNRFQ